MEEERRAEERRGEERGEERRGKERRKERKGEKRGKEEREGRRRREKLGLRNSFSTKPTISWSSSPSSLRKCIVILTDQLAFLPPPPMK